MSSLLLKTKLAIISARGSGSEKTISIKRFRKSNSKRLTNPYIVEYMKSKAFKDWVGETPADVEQTIVHKFNMLAAGNCNKWDHIDKELYEVRN